MKQYAKIDINGFFLEDVVVEKVWVDTTYKEDGVTVKKEGHYIHPIMDKYHIETLPNGTTPLLSPKWDGTDWVDGATAQQKEEVVENEKIHFKELLKEVHQDKVKSVLNYISNTDLYDEKRQEYAIKKEEAEKALTTGDYSFFDLSAQLKNITSKQYAEMVIDKANQMLDAEKEAVRRIGDIRSVIDDLIDDGKFFQAEKMLEYIKEMDPETIMYATPEQLVEIISTYSS